MSQSECLFCRLYADGDHVRKEGGFAAVRDINPKAPVHLLVNPERHVHTFRDGGAFAADEAEGIIYATAGLGLPQGSG